MLIRTLVFTFCTILSPFIMAIDKPLPVPTYKYPTYNMAADHQKLYYQNLFVKALENSRHEFGNYNLDPVHLPMLQNRALISLNRDIFDVYWTMTSKQREANYLAVRIPLMKGLIGYRVAIIHRNSKTKFQRIATLEQFKTLTAIQGPGWPDTFIMREAGFTVFEQNTWQNMFLAVRGGYADFFPRSVVEAWAEFALYGNDELMIDTSQLIHYPAAMYFFVEKDEELLARRLESGLRAMIKSGEFARHFEQYPSHKRALKFLKNTKRVVHRLENPFLPQDTPTSDSTLWHSID